MNFAFKFGAVSSSLLLIKLHLVIALIMYIVLFLIFDVEVISSIVAIAYLLIASIGHVRASMHTFSQMNNPELFNKPLEEPENFKDAMIKKNHYLLGCVWRMSKEWLYMKKTANLDFKSTT